MVDIKSDVRLARVRLSSSKSLAARLTCSLKWKSPRRVGTLSVDYKLELAWLASHRDTFYQDMELWYRECSTIDHTCCQEYAMVAVHFYWSYLVHRNLSVFVSRTSAATRRVVKFHSKHFPSRIRNEMNRMVMTSSRQHANNLKWTDVILRPSESFQEFISHCYIWKLHSSDRRVVRTNLASVFQLFVSIRSTPKWARPNLSISTWSDENMKIIIIINRAHMLSSTANSFCFSAIHQPLSTVDSTWACTQKAVGSRKSLLYYKLSAYRWQFCCTAEASSIHESIINYKVHFSSCLPYLVDLPAVPMVQSKPKASLAAEDAHRVSKCDQWLWLAPKLIV